MIPHLSWYQKKHAKKKKTHESKFPIPNEWIGYSASQSFPFIRCLEKIRLLMGGTYAAILLVLPGGHILWDFFHIHQEKTTKIITLLLGKSQPSTFTTGTPIFKDDKKKKHPKIPPTLTTVGTCMGVMPSNARGSVLEGEPWVLVMGFTGFSWVWPI